MRKGSESHSHNAMSQVSMTLNPILPNSPHVNFLENSFFVMGTLFDLTKVDHKLKASLLKQLNLSKISPKSSTTESPLVK